MNTRDSTSKNEIGTVFAYDERYSFLKGIPMLIRTAELSDLPALLAIYNDEVKNGVATFDTEPQTMEERRAWFDAHNIENHPLLTAVTDDSTIAGYASLSTFCAKKAYSPTVELSIYVNRALRGHGVGKALMTAVIETAKKDERTHRIISIITTENEASKALHRKFGFREVGVLSEVGFKFGRTLSVGYWELAV